jgi:transcriptional regulator with XRE-family HTH domain
MSSASRYELFQRALADARQERGLTQSEVAARLRKPQSFVSKYESGERRLDVIEFLEVCDAISISPSSILKKIHSPHD